MNKLLIATFVLTLAMVSMVPAQQYPLYCPCGCQNQGMEGCPNGAWQKQCLTKLSPDGKKKMTCPMKAK